MISAVHDMIEFCETGPSTTGSFPGQHGLPHRELQQKWSAATFDQLWGKTEKKDLNESPEQTNGVKQGYSSFSENSRRGSACYKPTLQI